jgi:hypothetical protein
LSHLRPSNDLKNNSRLQASDLVSNFSK